MDTRVNDMPEENRPVFVGRAPSRFVLWAENEDETPGEIVAWGLAFPNGAVVSPVGDGLASRFSSVERAQWIHSAARPTQLTWIDQPPPGIGTARGGN
nr:hypothetical protein [Micromonospora sp. DSM 115978]